MLFQPSEPKQNRRGKLNALRLENNRFKANASWQLRRLWSRCRLLRQWRRVKIVSLKMTFKASPYENLPSIIDANSPIITSSPVISSKSHYVNVFTVIYSSSNNTSSYSIRDTLVPTASIFLFTSSEQIACDVISFVIQASPHLTPK